MKTTLSGDLAEALTAIAHVEREYLNMQASTWHDTTIPW